MKYQSKIKSTTFIEIYVGRVCMDLVCGMYRVYICICVCGVYLVSGCMCAYMWHEVCAACVVVCARYLCVGVLEETKWKGWEKMCVLHKYLRQRTLELAFQTFQYNKHKIQYFLSFMAEGLKISYLLDDTGSDFRLKIQ